MSDHFNNYRELKAKRAEPATCGHPVRIGDVIGWNPRTKRTQCAGCWLKWSVENREAADAERMGF